MRLKLKENINRINTIDSTEENYGSNADRLDTETYNKYLLDLINCNDNYNAYYKNSRTSYDIVDEYIFNKELHF